MQKIIIILITLILTGCAAWKEGQKEEDNFIEPPCSYKQIKTKSV